MTAPDKGNFVARREDHVYMQLKFLAIYETREQLKRRAFRNRFLA
jgi:hypothetical protein